MEQNTIMQELMSQVLDQQNKTNTLIKSLENSINELRKQKTMMNLPEQQTRLAATFKTLPDELKKTQSGLAETNLQLANLKEQLKRPVKQEVKHQHRLHKGFIIAVILFMITVGQFYYLLELYGWLGDYRANDLKYRMLKLSNSPALMRVLNDNDSIFLSNEDNIEHQVKLKEQEKEAQLEALRIADEKEQESKEWRQKAAKGNSKPFKITKTQPAAK